MANKDTAKLWFQTHDYPTQAEFYQLFEWLRWTDVPLNIAEVSGLTEILNGLATPVERFFTTGAVFEHTIPIGYELERFVLQPAANCFPSAEIEDSDTVGLFGVLLPADPGTTIKPSGKSFPVF